MLRVSRLNHIEVGGTDFDGTKALMPHASAADRCVQTQSFGAAGRIVVHTPFAQRDANAEFRRHGKTRRVRSRTSLYSRRSAGGIEVEKPSSCHRRPLRISMRFVSTDCGSIEVGGTDFDSTGHQNHESDLVPSKSVSDFDEVRFHRLRKHRSRRNRLRWHGVRLTRRCVSFTFRRSSSEATWMDPLSCSRGEGPSTSEVDETARDRRRDPLCHLLMPASSPALQEWATRATLCRCDGSSKVAACARSVCMGCHARTYPCSVPPTR